MSCFDHAQASNRNTSPSHRLRDHQHEGELHPGRRAEFALSLHPEKTRLIEFGRFAAVMRTQRGLGKLETFNFLGFTLICGTSPSGKFLLRRKTRAASYHQLCRALICTSDAHRSWREVKVTDRRDRHRLRPLLT